MWIIQYYVMYVVVEHKSSNFNVTEIRPKRYYKATVSEEY